MPAVLRADPESLKQNFNVRSQGLRISKFGDYLSIIIDTFA
jgi:hypothetical protein